MKFFKKINNNTYKKYNNYGFIKCIYTTNLQFSSIRRSSPNKTICLYYYSDFISFFFKNGLSMRYNNILYKLINIFKFDKFVFKNNLNSYLNNFNINNFLELIENLINFIKPPFIIKTTSIPKKLKKKAGIKYIVKIVYADEYKKNFIAIKQIINNTSIIVDTSIPYRLYKSITHTLLEGKNSTLFKKKLLIFKKFFKL